MRVVIAALVCLLVITSAGCTGVGGPGSGDSTATPGGGSPTPAGTATTTPPVVYGDEPNATAMMATHNRSLREASSFAVRSNQTVVALDGNTSTTRLQQTSVNLTSGEVLQTVQEVLGGNATTYVAPDGSAYQRVDPGSYGSVEYREPPFPPDPTPTFAPDVLEVLPRLDTTHETRRVDGRTLHRYTAEGVRSAPEGFFGDLGRENVSAFRFEVAVVEGGHVRSFTYDLTYRGDVGERRVHFHDEITAVGGVAIEPPAWLPEAKAEIDEERTPTGAQTRTASWADPRVTIEVDLSRSAMASDPEIRTASKQFFNDGLNTSRVGFVARLYWPEDATEVRLTASYDPADLPEGYDEANVTLARFDPEARFFYPVDSVEVDVEANVVRGRIPVEYRGQTFVVMNYQRYLALFE